MKVLVTIPHYYRSTLTAPDGRTHGSVGRDPGPRIEALTACLTAIRRVCAQRACVLSHTDRQARLIEAPNRIEVEVVVCTVGDHHLLDRITGLDRYWRQHATQAQPPLLGYECYAVLRDQLGKFDFYCYLEDDIVMTDTQFFDKLDWFVSQFGDARLLQPNRYEAGPHVSVDKIYVDGDLPLHCTSPYQDVTVQPRLGAEVLGRPVQFQRTTNPHAGCFFLSRVQMEFWSRQPYFLDRSDAFIGAMESAASLGIMRSFAIYKPAFENAAFLEVRHYGTAYLSMIKS